MLTHTRTLTPLNLIKYYCRKCKNWSNHVIDTGPIYILNCCLGSVTGRWGLAWVVKGLVCEWPWVQFCGKPPLFFDGVSFKWDRLEREDSEQVLGLYISKSGWNYNLSLKHKFSRTLKRFENTICLWKPQN